MEHCENLDPIDVGPVENAERESPDDSFADVREYNLVDQRISSNPIENPLHFGDKLHTKTRTLGFVEVESRIELGLRLGTQGER